MSNAQLLGVIAGLVIGGFVNFLIGFYVGRR